jgi:hypothetical protein
MNRGSVWGQPVGLLPQGLSRSDMFRVMLGLTAGGSDP